MATHFNLQMAKDDAYVREHFFGRYPETAALVADVTTDE